MRIWVRSEVLEGVAIGLAIPIMGIKIQRIGTRFYVAIWFHGIVLPSFMHCPMFHASSTQA